MNVIILMNDSLRRDHVAAYGDPAPWARLGRAADEPFIHTPHLDRLATQSALFDRFYVSSYPTIPCRTDIFTGRYSFPHRPWQPLEPDDVVLSELVSGAGYLPVLFFDTPALGHDDYNFTRGFAGWEWIRGQHADRYNVDAVDLPLPAAPYKLRQSSFQGPAATQLYLRNTAGRVYERDWMCARTISAATDWLERNHRRGQPGGPPGFVLYIDMWDPHEPFDAPAFDVARYADPSFTGDQVIYPQYGRPDYLSPDEHNHVRALYAALVTLSDRWVGHLLDKLDVLGLSDNTLVIHLADHGHLFGDHDLQGKPGGTLGRLYEPSIRIPLMIRHPQGLGAGKRIAGLTQHVDLLSTILEFLDVAPPSDVEGHSLWPLVRGETERIRTHAFSGRYPVALMSGQRGQATQVATFDGAAATDTDASRLVEALTVTTEDWALISGPRGHPSELYHLGSDPAQERNVLTEHPAVARELHAALLAFLESVGTAESRIAPFRGDVTASDAAPAPPALAADTPLFIAEDAQGTTLTFRSAATARLLGFTSDGSSLRQTTFGALARTNPRALFCTPTQYYRLSDLA